MLRAFPEVSMKNYQEVARELMVVERAAWWNPRVRRIVKAAPLVVMFLLLNSRTARAACCFSPTPDPTADGSANSLRHAIQSANTSGQNCLIQLQAGTYTLTIKNTSGHVNDASSGGLDLTDSGHTVTILGKGAGVSIVNGNGIDRVFQVLGGANAAFSKLTIEGGLAQDDGTEGALPGTTVSEGGGILVQDGGHVTLSQVSVEGNIAQGGRGATGVSTRSAAAANGAPGAAGEGGGLFLSSGKVDLTDSDVSGNAAGGGMGGYGAGFTTSHSQYSRHVGSGGAGAAGAGGGLYVLGGSLGLFTSTVSGNRAVGGGGGGGGAVFVDVPAVAYLTNTQPGGNGGGGQGAGLFVGAGAVQVVRTTVSGNTASGGAGSYGRPGGAGGSASGAGTFVASGDINLQNSTLFGNTAIGEGGGGSRGITPGPSGDAAGGGLYLSRGSVSLEGVTLASNQALAKPNGYPAGSSSGGGIANSGAGLFTNTTLIGNNAQDSGNAGNGNDVAGAITTLDSLISDTAGATITNDGGNIFNQNPGLDPDGLESNGGPTQTVALEQGSLADGRGDNSICKEAPPTGLGGIDQRGLDRFRPGDELCDIGAFEFVTLLVQPFAPASLSFGSEAVGKQSPYQNVSVTNNQTTSVTLNKSVAGADPADFVVIGSCHSSLASQASCTISIAFHPKASGTRTAQLTVTDSPDPTSPYHVTLSGTGT